MLNENIIKDWENVNPCLKRIGNDSFYSIGDIFLYGFSFDILRGNKEYRVFINLINLASTIHIGDKIDNTRRVINHCLTTNKKLNFNIPINFHGQYFPEAKIKLFQQAPFPFCSNIFFSDIIEYLLTAIKNNNTGIVNFPILEIEFIIQLFALNKEKIDDFSIVSELKEKILTLDRNRINYFMGDPDKWVRNLYTEYENPELLIKKVNKRIEKFKKKSLERIEIII